MVEDNIANKENNIGEELDPEKEQDIAECLVDELEMHPDFEHLDPGSQADQNNDHVKKERMLKQIDVGNLEELTIQSGKMDYYQRLVLEIAVRFARGIIKAMKSKNRKPVPPIMMIHGGAGSGKSTVTSWG